MKRLWIGVVLLVLVLALGLWAADRLERTSIPAAADLDRAAELAIEGQWDAAQALSNRAKVRWEKNWPVTAALTAHEPMEYIDSLFAQLRIYAAAGDAVSFSAACISLAKELEALGKCHSFTLWNLL